MSLIPTFGGFGSGAVAQVIQDLTRTRGAAYQHALLGEIALDLITYFEGMEFKFGADYAEHALIEGKPRLQWTGDKLDEATWSLVFHAGFCDPERELLKLKSAVAKHEALPLVFSNGDYKGWFVPTEVTVTAQQTMTDGTSIWIEAKLTLREYVEPKVLAEQTPRKEPEAAEKPAGNGTKKRPAKTVKKTPAARPSGAPVCRNAP
jgi:phage protein U